MKTPVLVQFVPKIPAALLRPFLKGIGCTKIVPSVQNGLEAWVDFKFLNIRFEGHRDCEVWHFFADKDCPEELMSAFSAKVRVPPVPI